MLFEHIEGSRWPESAFDELAPEAPGPRKANVLDLGAPLRANVEFFAAYRCSLWIADVYRTLVLQGAEPAADVSFPHGTEPAALLPPAHVSPFDMVLAWDLPG